MKQPQQFLVRLTRLAGLMAIVWIPGTGALAQAPPPNAAGAEAPADPETGAPASPAIPLEEVPDWAQATTAQLDALLPEEASGQAFELISSELDPVLQEIESLLATTDETLATEPSIRVLQALEGNLREMLDRLQPWNDELGGQLNEAIAAIQQVDAIAAAWEATAEVARREGAAATTISRIQAVRERSTTARATLVEQRNRILTVRDRLVDPSSALAASLKQVQATAGARLQGIFQFDRAPLWSPQVRQSLSEEWQAGALQKFWQRLQQSGEYMRERGRMLGVQLALFAVLLLCLRQLRRRAQAWAEADYNLRHAQEVFERPWAMALLITVLCTFPMHPLAPRGLGLYAGIIAALAATRIGVHLVSPIMAPLPWGLMLLFVIERARGLLDATPTVHRVVTLVEMVGALVWLLWLLSPGRFAKVPEERRRHPFVRLASSAMRVGMVVLVLAIVADIAGWGELGSLLGSSVLRSSYLGFFFFVLFMMVQSLASFALVLRPLRLLRGVTRHRQLVRRRLELTLRVLAVGLWAIVVLAQLGLLEIVLTGIGQALGASASVGALSISTGDVLAFALTVWLSFLLARLLVFALQEDVFTRVRTGRGVPYAISGLVRYMIIFLGFLVALAAAGLEMSKLTVVMGGLGVGIGFGLQNVVNNFVSGLILLFERPIQVGDAIQLTDVWGDVNRIGMRASRIRTFDGSEVIVPNGMLVSEMVTNWTLSDKHRRVDVKVGVRYGTPAQKVLDLLLAVAKANPRVMAHPEPAAFFINFGDSALEFMLRAWIETSAQGYAARSELAVAIQEALAEAGIGVPFPQRDLHLVSVSQDAAAGLGTAPSPPQSTGPAADADDKS